MGIPAGCSISQGGNNKPHMDTKDDVGVGRSDLIPICKKPESPGKFYLLVNRFEMLETIYT